MDRTYGTFASAVVSNPGDKSPGYNMKRAEWHFLMINLKPLFIWQVLLKNELRSAKQLSRTFVARSTLPKNFSKVRDFKPCFGMKCHFSSMRFTLFLDVIHEYSL